MSKKRVFSFLAVCGIVLSGCSTGGGGSTDSDGGSASGGSGSGKEFNVVIQQELPSMDPSIATDMYAFSAINNVYEGLYRLDKESAPEPAGAAEEAEVSEDGLTYKIKLREDAKWTDGSDVVADDYVFAWQRTVDPDTASEYAYMFEPVANAAEITAGEKDKEELGIKAVSDHELEITLANPTPYFDYLLAFPSFFPQKESVVEEHGKDFAKTSDNAVYNGPFVLSEFDGPGTDTEWAYVKNDDYWDKDTVQLDKINVSVVKEVSTALNLFEDGQADDIVLTGELASQKANDDAFVSQPESSTFYMEMNQIEEDSPFRNENLRKAISYSIDRDALVNSILSDGSIASTGLVPEKTMSSPDGEDFAKAVGSVLEHDEKKAKEHWEKAKEELNIDSLDFEIIASDTDSVKKMMEYVQEALQSTLDGVKVSLAPVPLSVRLDRSNKGDFDVVIGGWGADYADASSFINLFTTGNSYNRGKWSSEEYDKLVDAAATTDANDPEKRWEDLIEAEKVIMAEQGMIPLYQKAESHMRNPKVKGVVAHAAGAQYDYKWVTIEE
ncbi:peptide ABC transporter substrate-binding protein [Enterococcus florum]|uniref:Peptide ABC transporter substrate-binding protein n=1 Tax=Enterococcus florum TaxID=2480627 RepID=A0A4P5P4B3_9ENTE|nr:peptide ABC transporter substrate-binding protein [Enterococcus florum]GCF92645.1 peptide ABC transporter substrate-binding protein [Enterococcus florum]